MRSFFVATAALIATVLVVSCTEQSPDKFKAPEFGSIEVNPDVFAATVQCEITNQDNRFSYGFSLQESGSTQAKEIFLIPSGE